MFLGHFGLALASKKVNSYPSLGTTFFAAQFVDLLWPFLLLAGIEKVEIDPGNTAFTPLNFTYYPYSHSLVAVLGWSFLFGIIYYAVKKKRGAALLLSVLVLSHWVLDLITHRPDLPLTFDNSATYGLGLWNNRIATVITELTIFAAGCFMYLRATQPINKWGTISFVSLVIFFLLIYFMNLMGEPPPSARVIGYVGLAQWIFIAWGYWIDAYRRPYGTLQNPKKGLE